MIVLALLLVQDTVPAWRASATYGYEALSGGRPAWHAATLRLSRRTGRRTLAAEALVARRFDLSDAGVAGEAWSPLWRRAYGSLRVQVAPGAAVLPTTDVALDLYQGLSGGWEAAGGYRRMQFGRGVDIYHAGLAKYAGNWYLRGRLTFVPRGGTTGTSGFAAGRRYGATADDWWEIGGGLGEELITVGAGPAVAVRRNGVALARVQRYVTPRTGMAAGVTYNGTRGFSSRTGVSVSLLRRW